MAGANIHAQFRAIVARAALGAIVLALGAHDVAAARGPDHAAETSLAAVRSSLVDLAAELGRGEIRFHFPAREGVRGCGDSICIEHEGGRRSWYGHYTSDCDCVTGPVRVNMRVRDGEIVRIKTRIGPAIPAPDGKVSELGELAPQVAADRLLALARFLPEKMAEDALLPAQLARDVVIWPELLVMARDGNLGEGLRKAAVFWLSQIAGDEVTRGLSAIVGDDDEELELRETAIFALSERDAAESVPLLVGIARTNPHPQLRRSAMFWLAQADDPRVLDLFEEILTGQGGERHD